MISKFLKWIIGDDYQTTFTGAFGAAAMVGLELYQKGTVDTKTIATAAGIAAVGYMARDKKAKDGV